MPTDKVFPAIKVWRVCVFNQGPLASKAVAALTTTPPPLAMVLVAG